MRMCIVKITFIKIATSSKLTNKNLNMEYLLFFLDITYGDYSSKNASNIEMTILGHLLASDISCSLRSQVWPTLKNWALDDSLGDCLNSNLTRLEKEGNYIFLTDTYSDEETSTEFKISRQQFAKLFDDWQEKVCKLKPKEVTNTYDNNEFTKETKD